MIYPFYLFQSGVFNRNKPQPTDEPDSLQNDDDDDAEDETNEQTPLGDDSDKK